MTALSRSADHDSYSTRVCRCGAPMIIVSTAARSTQWFCEACGRTKRR